MQWGDGDITGGLVLRNLNPSEIMQSLSQEIRIMLTLFHKCILLLLCIRVLSVIRDCIEWMISRIVCLLSCMHLNGQQLYFSSKCALFQQKLALVLKVQTVRIVFSFSLCVSGPRCRRFAQIVHHRVQYICRFMADILNPGHYNVCKLQWGSSERVPLQAQSDSTFSIETLKRSWRGYIDHAIN